LRFDQGIAKRPPFFGTGYSKKNIHYQRESGWIAPKFSATKIEEQVPALETHDRASSTTMWLWRTIHLDDRRTAQAANLQRQFARQTGRMARATWSTNQKRGTS
jgi:hypothetical protein